MAAEITVEWTRDLGDGRLLVMARDAQGYGARLTGFYGSGSTQEAALDDLLRRMQAHNEASAAFSQSLDPGGELDKKLQQIRQIVDQIVDQRTEKWR